MAEHVVKEWPRTFTKEGGNTPARSAYPMRAGQGRTKQLKLFSQRQPIKDAGDEKLLKDLMAEPERTPGSAEQRTVEEGSDLFRRRQGPLPAQRGVAEEVHCLLGRPMPHLHKRRCAGKQFRQRLQFGLGRGCTVLRVNRCAFDPIGDSLLQTLSTC